MFVLIWGFGKYGQLGNGANDTCHLPQLVKLPHSLVPVHVSCGGHFTAIVAAQRTGPAVGKVLTCGWGKYGRLGNGSEQDQSSPGEVSSLLDVTALGAGHWHGCAVSRDGQLISWGYNKQHDVLGRASSPPFSDYDPVPKPLPTQPGTTFNSVSCGYNYTIAITAEGVAFSWGCGKFGKLGHGNTEDKHQPTAIEALKGHRVKAAAAGYSHTGLVADEGQLFTCGRGGEGALGHCKDHSDKLSPVVVETLASAGVKVKSVSCSQGEHHGHTLVCSEDGEAWSWGDGYKGKLGHGNQESTDMPKKIEHVHFSGKVVAVACGGIHSAALTEDGQVYTWGCGSDGRLGHPEAKGHRYLFRSDTPRRVENLPSGMRATDLSTSYYHTAVVCSKP